MKDYFSALGITKKDVVTKEVALARIRENRRGYYVYSLWRVVDGDPEPFYIGKGHGIRLFMHFRKSQRSTNNPFKDKLMAELRDAGEEPLVAILLVGADEQNALALEERCISKIGRRVRGTGPLLNITDGGTGVPGNRSRIPVFAENILYHSMAEADRALALAPGQTRRRIYQGWPGYCLALGEPKPCRKGRRTGSSHHKAKAVFADFKRFDMLTEAAEALKVYPSAIYKRIQAGWPGYYFEKDGPSERLRPKRHSGEHIKAMRANTINKPVQVVVDGVVYRSFSAAGSALNLSYATIRNRCRDDRFPNYAVA